MSSAFSFSELDTTMIIIICASVLAVAAVVFAIAFFVQRSKIKKERGSATRVEKVKTIDGVRYTESDRIIKTDGSVKVTHLLGDITLERGKTYTAKKGAALKPGKYTALSADENVTTFNMRIGGYVREVSHNSSIVLAEGDSITAVSNTVVLR